MYLSRIPIDISKRKTIQALTSPGKFHGAIESSFIGERKRRLWRIDKFQGQHYILVLSQDKPDFTSFEKQFGIVGNSPSWITKDYDNFLKNIFNGSIWKFRVVANPTIARIKDGRGSVKPHITTEYQKQWLIKHSEKNGFIVEDINFDVVANNRYKFYHKKTNDFISILAVAYEGILKVTDADLFQKLLFNGLGRNKAYGMGLMTIARN